MNFNDIELGDYVLLKNGDRGIVSQISGWWPAGFPKKAENILEVVTQHGTYFTSADEVVAAA